MKITRVTARNYKSLALVAVNLAPLTFLVGPNGSGKSNFIDALRFVSDALSTTPTNALGGRGGIDAVRRKSHGHPYVFGIRIDLELPEHTYGYYLFEITAAPSGGFSVKREKCYMQRLLQKPIEFDIADGEFKKRPEGIIPKIEKDRLALTSVSGLPDFRKVFDLLTNMRFYNLVPDRIRDLQETDPGKTLLRDGRNAAAVLREIQKTHHETYGRICRLLSKVVPGTERAEYKAVGTKETLVFRQDIGDKALWNFDAINMSDGTLRTLGVLLALYQIPTPTLIAIEEPESTVHPAAFSVIVDALVDGASRSQILVSTHSPDLLDHKSITDDQIRVVVSEKGITRIGELSETSREAVREKLYSVGELMKIGELEPAPQLGKWSYARQPTLFDSGRSE